jgi:hypothetical protein
LRFRDRLRQSSNFSSRTIRDIDCLYREFSRALRVCRLAIIESFARSLRPCCETKRIAADDNVTTLEFADFIFSFFVTAAGIMGENLHFSFAGDAVYLRTD